MYDAGKAWHYVTLGLTELYDQSDASVGPNGIRCELSIRVAKHDATEPPLWPVAFLGKIASHVSQGAVMAQGVSFRTGPIPGAPREAGLEGAVALLDPTIEPRPGPFGKVGVILLVGLTGLQLDEIKQGGSAKLIAEIAADPAKQITSPIRPRLSRFVTAGLGKGPAASRGRPSMPHVTGPGGDRLLGRPGKVVGDRCQARGRDDQARLATPSPGSSVS